MGETDRARSITEREAAVLSSLFEGEGAEEGERFRAAQMARSTYKDAKRRVYAQGWVEDRYIPSPRVLGLRSATFALATPFADQIPTTVEKFRSDTSAVVVWRGQTTVLGVFLDRSPELAQQRDLRWQAEGDPSRCRSILVDLQLPTVPVFFDFSGAWSRFAGELGPRGYPRPLGIPCSSTGGGASVGTHLGSKALLGRPFDERATRAPHLLGPALLPRSQRKLVGRGLVQWRVLPNLNGFPQMDGSWFDQVVHVVGTLQPDHTPHQLFRDLTVGCFRYPFLFVSDGHRVLSSGLTVAGGRATTPAQVPGAQVMATYRTHLTDLEIFREPTRTLELVENHRYDRLFEEDRGAIGPI